MDLLTHFAEKTKPAIALNGVRYLRSLTTTDKEGETTPTYPPDELRKRYKEPTRSQTYIDRCVLIADCCIALRRQRTKTTGYYYRTEADYLRQSSYYYFILESELMRPHVKYLDDEDYTWEEETNT